MSLPNASQQQIDAMNKLAAEKMVKDGFIAEEVAQQEPVINHLQEEHQEVHQESPEYEESVEEEVEEVEEVVSSVKQSSQNKESNLRIMRERLERAERERDEAMKFAMSLNQPKQQGKQHTPVEQEEDFNIEVDDDSLIEGKHLKELVKEIKNLRHTVKGYEQKHKSTDMHTLEMRLQSQYPDFNKVVTQDNLVQLREMNPDLADSILSNKDQYKQAKLAYEMVRQMGIYKEDKHTVDRIIAQKNATKPRPLSSIAPTQSDSPISKANAFANAPLTKELKDKHYQEMLQAMKGM